MSDHKRKGRLEDAQFKIIVVGDSAVGKSSLLGRYIKGTFSGDYAATVGVQFASKVVKIDENFNVKLTIWDTAGQQTFRSIIKSYYRNSSALFLVYNIAEKQSFEKLGQWLAEAREHAPANVMQVLIGTHLDLAERQVSKQQAQAWIKKQNISLFFETSAKSSENVDLAFEQVAKQLFLQRINRTKSIIASQESLASVDLKQDRKKSAGGCCQ